MEMLLRCIRHCSCTFCTIFFPFWLASELSCVPHKAVRLNNMLYFLFFVKSWYIVMKTTAWPTGKKSCWNISIRLYTFFFFPDVGLPSEAGEYFFLIGERKKEPTVILTSLSEYCTAKIQKRDLNITGRWFFRYLMIQCILSLISL